MQSGIRLPEFRRDQVDPDGTLVNRVNGVSPEAGSRELTGCRFDGLVSQPLNLSLLFWRRCAPAMIYVIPMSCVEAGRRSWPGRRCAWPMCQPGGISSLGGYSERLIQPQVTSPPGDTRRSP